MCFHSETNGEILDGPQVERRKLAAKKVSPWTVISPHSARRHFPGWLTQGERGRLSHSDKDLNIPGLGFCQTDGIAPQNHEGSAQTTRGLHQPLAAHGHIQALASRTKTSRGMVVQLIRSIPNEGFFNEPTRSNSQLRNTLSPPLVTDNHQAGTNTLQDRPPAPDSLSIASFSSAVAPPFPKLSPHHTYLGRRL